MYTQQDVTQYLANRLTRREIYDARAHSAKTHDVVLAAVSFVNDANTALLLRSAACFCVKEVQIIGNLPPEQILRKKSGGMYSYNKIRTFASEEDFLWENRDRTIISAELTDESYSIEDFDFSSCGPITLVIGHETIGVPGVICNNSIPLYIPMRGLGPCLNTVITGSIFLYEIIKQLDATNSSNKV